MSRRAIRRNIRYLINQALYSMPLNLEDVEICLGIEGFRHSLRQNIYRLWIDGLKKISSSNVKDYILLERYPYACTRISK